MCRPIFTTAPFRAPLARAHLENLPHPTLGRLEGLVKAAGFAGPARRQCGTG